MGFELDFDILTPFDMTMMAINVLMFVFASPIVKAFRANKDDKLHASRIWTLRLISVLLFFIYLSELVFAERARQLSLTGLTLLIAFLVVHFLQLAVLHRYGRTREIQGTEYRTETYQSEIFSLLILILGVVTSVLFLINIWGLTSWLEATSVIGGLLLLIYSTKDVWAPDNINGLILLYNGDVEPGSVVRVPELDLLAYTIQTTLTQTSFRDLRSKHIILIGNARFRGCKIEVLSRSPGSGLMEYVDFNLAYGLETERVDAFFDKVWARACENDTSINQEKPGVARLLENGDHAVVWRFCYWVSNCYGLYDARFAVNRAAYELSLEEGISLATPMTHTMQLDQKVSRETVLSDSAG